MRMLVSLLLSIGASVLGTYLLRQLLSVSEGGEPGRPGTGSSNVNVAVVVIPVMAGNRWIIGARRPPPFMRFLRSRKRGHHHPHKS